MTHLPADSTADATGLSRFEKVALLSGQDVWRSRAIPRIGLRALFFSDGPHGLRKQAGSGDHLGLAQSLPATCFPTAATIANSWDVDLSERIGRALGEEAALLGVDVILGPGLNIKRSPLGGRNFEYFSEDPYLSGRLAAAYVRGIQSAGVAACPKHFAVNSQETRRMASDSVVDEKTLREIYLTGFEIVVREAKPFAIMSSYNLVNGTYASEHPYLLQDILRDEWGFDGAVVTDWGGGNDPVAAIGAGGTLQMPSPGFDSVHQILASDEVDEAALDRRVAEVMNLAERIHPVSVTDVILAEHQVLAQEAAERSLVLLKNDGSLLPLAPGTSVAVIGDFAFTPRYQGAGSSLVNPTALTSPLDALAASPLTVAGTAHGFERGRPTSPELIAEAVQVAQRADIVLVYLGLDEVTESEGKDRDHLRLPQAQTELLAAVAAANPRVVVVLAAGSVVEVPWLDQAQALVHGYLGGQGGAAAIVRALTGQVNPSGRLAETYPLVLEDTPTAGHFPEVGPSALYREGPYVGYRYYPSAASPVRFPFGYGLSYTQFEYSDLTVDARQVSFTVTNTGPVDGADVPQVYVTAPAWTACFGPIPAVELKGFQKVALAAGESRRITIAFDRYAFRSFDPATGQWVTPGGDWEVSVGHDAVDRPLRLVIRIAGEERPSATPDWTVAPKDICNVTDEQFAALLGRPLPQPPTPGPLGFNSPLCDLESAPGWLGRAIYRYYFQRGLRRAEQSGKPDLNLLFQYGMPFRSIANMAGPMADKALAEGVLTIINGRVLAGLGQVIRAFFANRRRQKAMQAEFNRLSSTTTTNSQG